MIPTAASIVTYGHKVLPPLSDPLKRFWNGFLSQPSIFVVELEGYAYLVPFVETEDEVSLKTIIPSRKATKYYLRRKADEV